MGWNAGGYGSMRFPTAQAHTAWSKCRLRHADWDDWLWDLRAHERPDEPVSARLRALAKIDALFVVRSESPVVELAFDTGSEPFREGAGGDVASLVRCAAHHGAKGRFWFLATAGGEGGFAYELTLDGKKGSTLKELSPARTRAVYGTDAYAAFVQRLAELVDAPRAPARQGTRARKPLPTLASSAKRVRSVSAPPKAAPSKPASATASRAETGHVRLKLAEGKALELPRGAVELTIDRGKLARFDSAPQGDRALKELLAAPAFADVRSLRAAPIALTWSGLSALCASPAVRGLTSLELDLELPSPALPIVLGSSRLSHLVELSLGVRHICDIPRGSLALVRPPATSRVPFDTLDGLPALETLRLGNGIGDDERLALLRSPLVRRVRSLRVVEAGDLVALTSAVLPRLRALAVHGHVSPPIHAAGMRALVASPSFAALESLDLSDANLGQDALAEIARPGALPALRTLDLRSCFRYQREGLKIELYRVPVRSFSAATLDALRTRLGAGLLLDAKRASSS